ncbi:TraB/GumN family protein [Pacificoceanicola onchidii]|uniref:TraB/GumN family protein n=1 Tax=Pacificoceanicola onchidii TaxID=2562685 RepID=UPI001455F15D|nr:TraB/GumN family protein [Pacificoceanicola onchidii]
MPTLTAAQQDQLAAALDGTPYPSGNHWLAEKDGEQLHLIGTIHLDDPRLDAPVERLTPVIENASLLLLELPKADQEALMTMMSSDPGFFVLENTSLPELLSEKDWERIKEAMAARGIPGFMAAKFEPWYIAMVLAMPPCMMQKLAEPDGVDARLEAIAGRAQIPTRALEPYDSAIRLFTDSPRADQIDFLMASVTDTTLSENLLETMFAGYVSEEHAATFQASLLLTPVPDGMSREKLEAEQAEFLEALLFSRNRAWIPVTEQALADTDGPVVAAFGAGHLAGVDGVLDLLSRQGYTLTRQNF